MISLRLLGNTNNKHAAVFDPEPLVEWFNRAASEGGDVVPLHLRLRKKIDGRDARYYGYEDNTLLPAQLTWEQLRYEYENYVNDSSEHMPSLSSFRSILKSRCPNIRIRSRRDQVCDLCAIYQTRTRSGAQEEIEAIADHVMEARDMR